MKRSYISLIVLALAISVSAQAPLSFKYQAYLRNADGTIRANEFVTLQVRILQGSINGTPRYTEVHNTQTNSNGLVSVNVGEGSTSSNMAIIQWGSGPYFLDLTVNGVHLGTTELLSVPFALYANETGDSFSGNYSDLSGAPSLALVATTGNYSDLVNTPHFAAVATTGSYSSLINVPASFTPSDHIHAETDITGLQYYTDDSISGDEIVFDLWDKDVSDDFVGDMGGVAITNLADPVDPQDAATRAYVDSLGGFSGSFNDLTDVPITLDRDSTTNLPVSFDDLIDIPLTLDLDSTNNLPVSFDDLIDIPLTLDLDSTNNLPVSFNDLTDVPATLDRDSTNNLPVSFNDLIDVPITLDLDSTDNFTGDMGGATITNVGDPVNPQDAATRAYVDASSGSFSGSFNDLSNVPANLDVDDTDDFDGDYGSLTNAPAQIGDLGGDMGGANITNLADPVNAQDAATRAYVELLETTVASLEADVLALTSDIATLQDALNALTARVVTLEGHHPPPP